MMRGPRSGERLVDRLARARCCSASAGASPRPASGCRAPSRRPGRGSGSTRASSACGRRSSGPCPSRAPRTSRARAASGSRRGESTSRSLAQMICAADREAAGDQALGDRGGVQRPVPDVGDLAGEQRPGLAPVGPVVVQHLAGALRRRGPARVAPGRVVARRHRADRSPSGAAARRRAAAPRRRDRSSCRRAAGGAPSSQRSPGRETGTAGGSGVVLLARVGRAGVAAARRSRRPRSRACRGRRRAR